MAQHQEGEKGRLEFEGVNGINNAEVRQVAEQIRSACDHVLFHWKSFPINLPPSLTDQKGLCLKDVFILPTFDELDALTTDSKGNPKFLSHNQLQSIKRRGQFTVASENFPGQTHVWRLHPLFQKGIETAREEFLDGVAFGLRFLVVYVPQLLLGPCYSVLGALNSLRTDLINLIDLLAGWGRVHVPNVEKRIEEERAKFLVAELRCKGDGAREVGRYVRNQASKALREKVTMAMERPPPVPFRFTTPVSMDVDLRLFDRDLFRRLTIPLSGILEKASRGFLSVREKVIRQLSGRKMTAAQMEMEANQLMMEEYLKRVAVSLRNSPLISSCAVDMDRLLLEQGTVHVLMQRAVDEVSLRCDSYLEEEKKLLVGEYPILSRDEVWMKIQMEKAKKRFLLENQWMAHEIGLELCADRFLKQHAYFLARDLVFMRDTSAVLRKEIQEDKIPCRTFEWKTLIWRPENYVVMRTLNGNTETIPTVISQLSTTITNPRSDPYHPMFSLRRVSSRCTTTRWPLWRLTNYFFRTFCWILNSIYFFGYQVPWNSALSFQALFRCRPFLVSLVLNQVNGSLCPKKSSETATLASRLRALWRHVSKARTKFESEPDTGFLGKGGARFVNRFWNYGLVGFLPSLLLLILFPLAAISISLTSLLLALTAPLWVPVLALVFHIFSIVCYDADAPLLTKGGRFFPLARILLSILFLGLAKSVLCLLGAAVVCPLTTFLILIYGLFSYGIRLGWDWMMFHALIRPKGRLPSSNSALVKRTVGPGLGPEFYFEISIDQALIAFQTRLEGEELTVFYQLMNRRINSPLSEFKCFLSSLFAPFSGDLRESEGVYKDLIRETHSLRAYLEEKVNRRRSQLETGLGVGTRSRIRMAKDDLERALMRGCRMAEGFYPTSVFSRMGTSEEVGAYWEGRGLDPGDWKALTALLFTEVFSQDFLTPLTESDVAFRLHMDVEHIPIPTEYAVEEDDEWNEREVVTLSKVNYQIHSPYLDVSAFNPLASRATHLAEDAVGREMAIPLPIPHPAYISVIIHNRETESPFQWETPIAQAIIKALQDSGPVLEQDCVSLDLSSISSSDSLEDDTEVRTSSQLEEDECPSPLNLEVIIPEGSSPPQRRQTPSLPLVTSRHVAGHSSKASLASPEEMSIGDLNPKFGTSV